jgi:hypothetical protein
MPLFLLEKIDIINLHEKKVPPTLEGILAKSLAGKHHYFEKKHWLCTSYIDSSSRWGFLGI